MQRDLSNPTYKFIDRMNGAMFAGTPYEHDPLGTKSILRCHYWCDVEVVLRKVVLALQRDPGRCGRCRSRKTMAEITELFGGIPSHPLPARPAVQLKPFKSDTFTIDSNLPYVLGFIAYRMPGTDSPDNAATQILMDVLNSQRADLYGMVPAGKALAAEFVQGETYPKASVAFGLVALPAGSDAASAIDEMRKIIEHYAANGVPEELVDAAKRSEIAQAEFQRNSIPGLADVWSDALAAEGRNSPEEDIDAIRKVTLADVNRVAKENLLNTSTITATLKPAPNGQPVAAKGYGGAEQVTSAPTKPVELPEWAAGAAEADLSARQLRFSL